MNRAASESGHVEPAVLDAQALAGLSMLDPTGANRLVERVLGTYQGSLGRLMQQMTDAMDLSKLCAAAEHAVREGQVDSLPALVVDLQAEARRVEQAVLALLSR
jgi:signal transduction histidine kinase